MTTRELILTAQKGFREVMYFDDTRPKDMLIKTFSDSEVFKERARVYSEAPPGKDLRHAAVIPPEVLDAAFREGWVNDQKRWRKWANDPNNQHLRTWKGRL